MPNVKINVDGKTTLYDETSSESVVREAAQSEYVSLSVKLNSNSDRIKVLAVKCAKFAKDGSNPPTSRELAEIIARIVLAEKASES